MPTDANWRLDPFTDSFIFETITDEVQQVNLDAELGRYGFRLNEAPRIRAAGTDTLTVVENITGGATWTEVTNAPSAGEYRVDKTYDQGFVEFHSADAGKNFAIDYQGKGSIVQYQRIRNAIEEAVAQQVDNAEVFLADGNYNPPDGSIGVHIILVAGGTGS